MRVPLGWLADYVDIGCSPEELAERLSAAGVAVEQIERRNPERIDKVVVARILTLEKHPNADRLRVAQVDIGQNGPLQIVTGAPNVEPGHRIPVALVGARLAGGTVIKPSTLRGLDSFGMMCSATELGLPAKDLPADQRDGVLVFPEDTVIGESVTRLLALDDAVLHLEIFANRPDLLGLVGIAHEVAALLRVTVKRPPSDLARQGSDAQDLLAVTVEDSALCPRYVARVVDGVTVGPSPLWMQGRLQAAGFRPINNIVDITNYIMVETGQPLHAFDYHTLKGSEIRVRRSREGESITTIDGELRALDAGTLVIADRERPVAVAGVMGGADTEITTATTRVVIESASFQPAAIRRASQALGLRSESSRRFEKGLDYYGVLIGADRAAQLMADSGGKIVKGVVEVAVPPPDPVTVTLRRSRLTEILGVTIPDREVDAALAGLGFKLRLQDHAVTVEVPSFRQDVRQEEDLVEEVARHWGYDRIPYRLPARMSDSGEPGPASAGASLAEYLQTRAGQVDPVFLEADRVRDVVVRAGFSEAVTLTMTSRDHLVGAGMGEIPVLEVRNPLSEDQRVLRPSPLAHLVAAVARNLRVRTQDVALFEITNIYGPPEPAAPALSGRPVPESRRLALAATGLFHGASADFFGIKGGLEALLGEFGLCAAIHADPPEDAHTAPGRTFITVLRQSMHPGRSALAYLEGAADPVAVFGELHPRVTERLDIKQPVAYAEVDLDGLLGRAAPRMFKTLPRHPAVSRDVAMILPATVPAAAVEQVIRSQAGALLAELRCFDWYEGPPIPEGRRNLAFTLTFQAPDRTLTDDEVRARMDAVAAALKQELGAQIRE